MAKTSGQLENERRIQKNEIKISDISTCYFCKSTGLKENDKYCPNCRFPQNGTQSEMKRFLINIKKKKQLLQDQKKAVKKAKVILFILAGLNFLVAILLGIIINKNLDLLIGGLIGGIVYLSLAIWCKYKPFAAILSGLFVFIVFTAMSAIADPHTLYKGLIMKIIVISGFIYGYKGVKDSEKLEKELIALKESKDLEENDEL